MKRIFALLLLLVSLPFFIEIRADDKVGEFKHIDELAASPTIAYQSSSYSFIVNQTINNVVPIISGSPTSFTINPQLPAGLTINPSTGVISGVPSSLTANTTYTVTATNSSGSANTTITIQVLVNPCPIVFSYSPSNISYTQGYNNSNLVPIVTSGVINAFSISPALPSGLNFDSSIGVISGTPTSTPSTNSYVVTAINNSCSASASLNISINPPAPTVNFTPRTIAAVVGQAITPLTPVITGSPVTVSISPALPVGLFINSSTGAISGTPTTISPPVAYTITVTNVSGSYTDIITISVNNGPCPIAVSYPSSNVFVKGNFVSIPIASISGTPNTFQVLPGSTQLPAGLTINPATGTISGIPTNTTPVTSFTIRANNGTCSATSTLSIEIKDIQPTLSYPSPIVLAANQPANIVPISFSNVTSVSISAGTLPTGLSLNQTTGVISGTPSVFSAPRAITVTGTNATGDQVYASFVIEVTGALCPLTFSYPSSNIITKGSQVSIPTLSLTGVPIAFQLMPGSAALPVGLTINPNNGTINGVPLGVSFGTYTISAMNGTCSTTTTVSIQIRDLLPLLVYPTQSSFAINQPVNFSPTTITNVANLSISAGTLPTGLSFDTSTGRISGTPTVASAPRAITVTGTNLSGDQVTANFVIEISGSTCPLTFSYPLNNIFTKGSQVSIATIAGTGVPTTYQLFQGSTPLPTGLTVNPNNGTISGVTNIVSSPTSYTISANNSTCSATATVNIQIRDLLPLLNYPSLFVFAINQPVNITPSTLSNVNSLSITAGTLPAGLVLNTSTGVISGTPTQASAPRSLTVVATNSSGTANSSFVIEVTNNICPIAFNYSPNSNSLLLNSPTSLTPTLTAGIPNTFSITPNLPAGLTFNPVNGTISGTPSAIQTPFSYTISANNGTCSATASLTLSVLPAIPTINYSPKTKAFAANQAVTPFTPVITNGPVSVTISPALPVGLSINSSSGLISGTPTAISALRAYTVTATNASGTSTDIISLEVTAPCPILASYPSSTQVYTLGRSINGLLPTLNGVANAFSINPALPSGLSLDPTNGRISGTPIVASPLANYVITANNNSCSDTAVVKIEVKQPCFSFPANPSPTPMFFSVGQPLTYATVAASELIGNESGVFTVTPSLPAGMTFNPNTGVISGTPSNLQASANYTICYTNACGTSCRIITLTPSNSSCPLNVSYSPYRNNLTKNRNVSLVPTITAGVPTTFSVTPNLPAGLSLNSTNGIITGSPTVLSAANSYFVVANNAICVDTAVVNIRISPETPTIAYAPKTRTLAINQTVAPFTPIITGDSVIVTISPALPAGLSINPFTGEISGTPTTSQALTAYTVTASNSSGTGTDIITLAIESATCPLAISYSPGKVVLGTILPITPLTPTVTNGVPNAFTVSPSLPSGLILNPTNGVITGRPSSLVYGDLPAKNYVITANNSACSDTAIVNISVKIDVVCPLLLYISPSKSFLVNQPISPVWNPIRTSGYYSNRNISFVDPFINQSNFSITPALPAGMMMNANTGEISGTPLAPSSKRGYRITFNNPTDPCYTSQEISFEVLGNLCPLDISYSPFKRIVTKNAAVSEIIPVISGGIPTVYTIYPNLPSGLNFNLFNGTISGTPTSFSAETLYTVTASNSACSDTAFVNIRVKPEAPTVVYTPKTRILTVNQVVSPAFLPVVTGDSLAFNIVPSLPQGLSINRNTGAIEGMPNVVSNLTSYVVTASNSGGSATDIITLQTTPSSCPLNVSYPSMKNTFVKGNSITGIAPSITSGSATAFVISPALPAGLILNASNGIITGTPSALIGATNYVVTAVNATCTDTANVNIRIKPAVPLITYNPKVLSFAVNQTITPLVPIITGDSVYVGISPSLPAGLLLDTRTGIITGTPVSAIPPVAYTITVTNSSGSSTDVIAIQITASNCPISANYLYNKKVFIKDVHIDDIRPNLMNGIPNNYTINAPLPAGITLNMTNGVISGTPTAPFAATNFIVTASAGSCSDTLKINLRVKPALPSVSYPTKTKTYSVNQAISAFIPSISGDSVVLNISPALPSGLSFNQTTATITGTPTALSPLTLYTITASNSTGVFVETIAIQIIGNPPVISYLPSNFSLTKGASIGQITPLVNGQVDNFTISPNLPSGLSINPINGFISGIPTTASSATNYIVTARNTAGTDTARINLRIYQPAPTISYSIKSKTFNLYQPISPEWAPVVTGEPTTFTISPALPRGLVINQTTGAISGTPLESSVIRSFTVTASNSSGLNAIDIITITIVGYCPLTFSYGNSSQTLIVGNAITRLNPVITAGVPNVFSISPSLPSGLNFNAVDGSISGIPTSFSAQTNYLITANNNTCSATNSLSIQVNNKLPIINYTPSSRVLNTNQAINPVWNVVNTGGAISSFEISPTLPTGLVFNSSTGAISGTPVQIMAPRSYTILAYNETGVGTTVFALEVIANPCPIEISYTPNNIELVRGKAMSALTPIIINGIPNAFSISPSLPAGLNFNAVNGIISGVPLDNNALSTYVITAASTTCSATTNLAIRVKYAPPTIAYTPNSKTYIVNQSTATSWVPVLTGDSVRININPALPAGLSIDTNTGIIQGIPTVKLNQTSFTITASNQAGSVSTTISLNVNDAPPKNLLYTIPAELIKGLAINPLIPTVTGVVSGYTVSPSLPRGLLLNSFTGEISGTPTQGQSATNYIIKASNPSGFVAVLISLTIRDLAPSGLRYTTPNVYTKGKAITSLIPVVTGDEMNFTISPALPLGLVLNGSNGIISGTPTVIQNTTNYIVSASNNYGTTTTTLSITIKGPVILATQIPISGDDMIKLSPNPFSNYISLDFSKELGQNADVIISDMQGNIKFTKSNVSPGDKIDLSSLSEGSHILRLSSNEIQKELSVKIIKLK